MDRAIPLHYGNEYDTTEEFNTDSKADCDQLNLARSQKKVYERRN